MSNIFENNHNKIDLALSFTEFWDLGLSKEIDPIVILNGSNYYDDNLISYININDDRCYSGNTLYNNIDYKWINTFNITEVFAQYEIIYPDFKFMGAQPRDFDKVKSTGIRDLDYDKLIRSGIFRLGFIFNLDEHDESGSHWVALFADLLRGQIYFIDSVGEEPAKEFRVLMNRIKDLLCI